MLVIERESAQGKGSLHVPHAFRAGQLELWKGALGTFQDSIQCRNSGRAGQSLRQEACLIKTALPLADLAAEGLSNEP